MAESAVATVLGGFWGAVGVSTLTQIKGRGPQRRKAAQALSKQSTMDLRARMSALDGVVPGATALENYSRVAASSELGGVRAVETITLINRATVAGDVTIIEHDINNLSNNSTFGASPPANLDGNPLGTR